VILPSVRPPTGAAEGMSAVLAVALSFAVLVAA
jgi:hypothetical protein